MIFGEDFCGLIAQSEFDSKCDNSAIAPVESNSTASRAYAIGEHFLRDGAFCTAKTAIAQGAAFTLNTNYTAGTVGSELEDTGWQTTTATSAGGSVKYRKVNGVVFVTRNVSGTIATNTWTTLGTLPQGYRPTSLMQVVISSEEESGVFRHAEMQIKTDGSVDYRCSWTSNYVAPFQISFVAG